MDINWVEVLGWFGSTVLVVSLLQTRVVRLRLINLGGSLILAAYNLVIGVWPMVGLNVVLTAINVFFLVKLFRTQHDTDEYTVLEVAAEDHYLRHVLRVHRDDIAGTDPDFDEPRPDQQSFLVLRADEVVGVVVVEDAGGGVAQVVLDWVTPRYRDLSPGEFVFRRSELFTSRGYTKVLTSPGMVSTYYSRIGFSPAGDRFELVVT